VINFPKKFKHNTKEDLAYFSKRRNAFFVFGEYENQKVCIYLASQPFSGDALFLTKTTNPENETFVNEILVTQLCSDYFFTMFSYNEELLEKVIKANSMKKTPFFHFADNSRTGWNRILYFQGGELRFINKSVNTPFETTGDEIVEEASVFQDCLTVKGKYKVDKKDVEAKLEENKKKDQL